ncbi:hypothetical protein [Anaplasma phagocytophilum]|uniref:Uncharacterized protein n=3 Tax=Anaplasma phagocytophilum TaxID=948 RepID=Q2GJG2_ANAPZ|nr:hypothetical protein [Anaplasma phagocytophilum]KJZ98405.1 hypothetical protein APHCR_0413 [Anaplasma phagocytophilum str. CR1007]ABD43615.1 hypothetical protein APH_0916 [Anaplasma phagocytophilum str. HZ]AGR79554.1 hypothetical protein YYU_04190 [Anaplasma phagocytophilum str. HZ2]AGR80808.1 hypothetical protein WSQ_04215 [Anaplasma phagocytophilum str. JM]AGR82060.1 hypothetical protein YYY_04205 [Anaplasma phagocytophilum str. Dog2]
MLSRINKGLGCKVFAESENEDTSNKKLPSLCIPESVEKLGIVIGVCGIAALLMSTLLNVVYWILIATYFVSTLCLFVDYVIAASAYLAANTDILPFISTPEDRLKYSEGILKKRFGKNFCSEISTANADFSLEHLPQSVLAVFCISLLMTFSLEFAVIIAACSTLPILLKKGTYNIYENTTVVLKTETAQLEEMGYREAVEGLANRRFNANRMLSNEIADIKNPGYSVGMRSSFFLINTTEDTPYTEPRTVLMNYKSENHSSSFPAYIS